MQHVLGGKVARADVREYGKTEVLVDKTSSKIFQGVSEKTTCWMSHFDTIFEVAEGFEITAHTADCFRWQQQKMKKQACTESSTIRKSFIQ